MAFTTGNIAAAEAAWRKGMGALLVDTQVTPYQGTPVTVRLRVGMRRGSSAEVTGGADAENQLATIDADDWDTKVGRVPQKGDVILWGGERMAILSNQTIAPAGNKLYYKCRIRG